MSDVDVRTADGEEIEVAGDIFAEDPNNEPLRGKVLSISEPEGELGEENTMKPILPRVEVEWSNGDKETFEARALHIDPDWEAERYECDELYSDVTLLEEHHE